MVYGYARVSTEEQSLEAQAAELKAMGCEKVFLEKASGKDRDRPVLEELMASLRAGDVLLVVKIDRLARSLKDLIFLLDEIAGREAVLKLGSSSFDFSTAEGRLTANLLGSVAEFERQLISERTKLGLKNARAMGRTGGRPKGFSAKAKKLAKKAYENRKKGLSVKENLLLTGIRSRETLFKYIKHHATVMSGETGRPVADNGLELAGLGDF